MRNELVVNGLVQSNTWYFWNPAGDASDAAWAVFAQLVHDWWLGALDPFSAPSKFVGAVPSHYETALRWVTVGLASRFTRIPAIWGFVLPQPTHPALPPNATLALEWTTSLGGRSGHGRSYLLGLAENLVEPGSPAFIKSDVARDIISIYSQLPVLAQTAGSYPGQFRFVVYHREGFPIGGGALSFGTEITGCRLADLVLDSQKGRLPGHVHH